MNTVIINGFDGLLYDVKDDVVVAGIYGQRKIKRDENGEFWVKRKGYKTRIPEEKIESSLTQLRRGEVIKTKECKEKANAQRRKSNDAFMKEHGFSRDLFCRWLVKMRKHGKLPYSRLNDIPSDKKEIYFDMYRARV